MAKTIDYEFKRGDTKLLKKFRPVDQNGNVLLLTNLDNIYFTMKKNENGTAIIKKNIGNGITYGVDGYYHITLQASETANLPAGTYVISGCPTGGSASTYRIMMWNSSWVYVSQDVGNSNTFNLENDTTNNKVQVGIYSGTTVNNLVFKPMIRFASITDDTYEPYTNGASPNPDYPQEITNVTGDVEVKVQNKNLFDITETPLTNSSTTRVRPQKYTLLKKGTHVISFIGADQVYIMWYDKKYNKLGETNWGNSGFAFSLSESYYIIPVFRKNNDQNILAEEIKNIQIEQNTTSTPYTSHKEQVLPLTLGNIELCKIGDYQDYFYKQSNKWYLHKEIDKKILDGSENYTLVSAEGYVKFTSNQLINNSVATGICISSHFHLGTNAIGAFKVYNNNWVDIFTEIMTLEEFKTWLSNNNVSMYYACTPTDTEITDTTLISQLEAINNALSYEEQTNISSNTIALFNVEAYQSTKLVLEESNAKYESLEARVALLE